jgi:hypothetical protein
MIATPVRTRGGSHRRTIDQLRPQFQRNRDRQKRPGSFLHVKRGTSVAARLTGNGPAVSTVAILCMAQLPQLSCGFACCVVRVPRFDPIINSFCPLVGIGRAFVCRRMNDPKIAAFAREPGVSRVGWLLARRHAFEYLLTGRLNPAD